MEGRTIVRPNDGLPQATEKEILASMEGRTIVRPNKTTWRCGGAGHSLQWRAGQLSGQTARELSLTNAYDPASMEGRTIVRPNPSRTATQHPSTSQLQWRAGQLSGQT